jgi:hypothetical protein
LISFLQIRKIFAKILILYIGAGVPPVSTRLAMIGALIIVGLAPLICRFGNLGDV